MTDHLSPQAETWRRDAAAQAPSIRDAATDWRAFADREADPVLADAYRRLADLVDTYLEMRRGGRPCG